MTEHLTRHGAGHDEEFRTGEHDLREPGDAAQGTPGFREPGADGIDSTDGADGTAVDHATTDHATAGHTDTVADGTGADRTDAFDAGETDSGERGLSTADLASAGQDSGTRNDRPADSSAGDEAPTLFPDEKITGFRDRWQAVQTGFVDDPQQAVQDADELVAAVISSLAKTFAEHKSELEAEWKQGQPATEELRQALRRYRAFFDQLLPH